MSLRPLSFAVGFLLAAACVPAQAQVSLATAVDLALSHSPRVRMAAADVAKAQAGLDQTKDVFIPAVNGGAGLGNSYGYSPNPPTLFTVSAGSLIFNTAQFDLIRAARSSVDAARLTLDDVRLAVMEDAAVTFNALDHDQQRQLVLEQQYQHAQHLVDLVQQRLDGGVDTRMDLLNVKLTAAQLHLSLLHGADEAEADRDHLSRLTGLAISSLRAEGGLPEPPPLEVLANPAAGNTPAVAAAFATAHSKLQVAFSDRRYLYRPQFSLVLQYSRYATFANSFSYLQTTYSNATNGRHIGANEEAFGVQITIPVFDKMHSAKARESAADADRALHEAEYAQFQALDGQARLRHSLPELMARNEVASLEQQLAQQQLEIVQTQLQVAVPGGGPQMTPKDEANARIAERTKYLGVVDASYQLRQAQINLMRQTGQLQDWIRSAARAPQPPLPHP